VFRRSYAICSHDDLSPIREKSPTHFFVEWVAIMNEVAEGYTFYWAKMMSNNLAKEIPDNKYRKSKGNPTPFYMSTYVMDAIVS